VIRPLGLEDVVANAKKSAGAPPPSASAGSNRFEKRVTLDLTAEDHRALRRAALDEGATMAALLRALVALFREEPAVQAKVRRRLEL